MTKTNPVQQIAGAELVGYDYFAKELDVQLRTIYAYASETNAQRLENFPRPITPAGHRQPLFDKADADRFIAERRAGSTTGKGRVKARPLTKAQRAAVPAAATAAVMLFASDKPPKGMDDDRGGEWSGCNV